MLGYRSKCENEYRHNSVFIGNYQELGAHCFVARSYNHKPPLFFDKLFLQNSRCTHFVRHVIFLHKCYLRLRIQLQMRRPEISIRWPRNNRIEYINVSGVVPHVSVWAKNRRKNHPNLYTSAERSNIWVSGRDFSYYSGVVHFDLTKNCVLPREFYDMLYVFLLYVCFMWTWTYSFNLMLCLE